MLRLFLVILAVSALPGAVSAAQAPQSQAPAPAAQSAPSRLRVYLDCDCFQEYLRDEISWVDFVRQPQDADVHILSSDRETGGGGRELVLRFVGRGRFETISMDLRAVSQVAESENVRRAQVLRTVEARASRQRDQLSLPRRSATPEEQLLQLRELQSVYEVSLSFGVRYSFGSLFNNVVNPRFGGNGD